MAPVSWGRMVEMGNIVLRAGFKPILLAILGLECIALPRLADAITLPMPTDLCGSLPEMLVQHNSCILFTYVSQSSRSYLPGMLIFIMHVFFPFILSKHNNKCQHSLRRILQYGKISYCLNLQHHQRPFSLIQCLYSVGG